MTLPNHKIKIEVIDIFTEEVIGRRETADLEVAEQILADIPNWIKNKEQAMYCCICESIEKLKDIEGIIYCENCVEKIISGEIKLNK